MDYEIKSLSTKTHTDAEREWIQRFNDTLREDDRRELIAAQGSTMASIKTSIAGSEDCFMVTGEHKEPLVLYGKCKIANIPGRMIWCMATTELGPYEREFARVSRRILREWAEEYGLLWNAIGDFNEPAKRWLKWCGAEFGKPLVMGGEMFLRFYIRGK